MIFNKKKIVYAIHEELNLNEDSPNHDIYKQALECMTKSIYPDLLFITKEDWLNKTVTYPIELLPVGLKKNKTEN